MLSHPIRVVAAIIFNSENQFLIARKKAGMPLAGFYEFPGGKVEDGEDDRSALIREIREELNIELKEISFSFDFSYSAQEKTIEFVFFKALIAGGEIRTMDHDHIVWTNIPEIEKYNLAPADREAIKHILKAKSPGN
jgi:8-oxo-dGTP diphosphatase